MIIELFYELYPAPIQMIHVHITQGMSESKMFHLRFIFLQRAIRF